MTGSGLSLAAAAGLMTLAAALAVPPSPARRLARAGSPASGPTARGRRGRAGRLPRRGISLADARVVRAISVAAGIGVGLVVGGAWGVAGGVAIALGGPYVIARMEPRARRHRREALERQASGAADLLAACLASGAPVTHAVNAVAEALGPPIAEPLRGVVASLELGADPVEAWRALADEPGLGALGRAVARSAESGAPLATLLPGIADDVRRADRVRAETAARAAGVRAVAPLAACFLPAFLLLGVVPIVVSLALPLIDDGVG